MKELIKSVNDLITTIKTNKDANSVYDDLIYNDIDALCKILDHLKEVTSSYYWAVEIKEACGEEISYPSEEHFSSEDECYANMRNAMFDELKKQMRYDRDLLMYEEDTTQCEITFKLDSISVEYDGHTFTYKIYKHYEIND